MLIKLFCSLTVRAPVYFRNIVIIHGNASVRFLINLKDKIRYDEYSNTKIMFELKEKCNCKTL